MFETAAIQIHEKLRCLLDVGGRDRGVVSIAGVVGLLLLTSCRLVADPVLDLPLLRRAKPSALDWPALEARASSVTGRVWTSPVEHFEVSDEELDARLQIETALVFDAAMVARAERELATLGLAPRGFDLRATLREVESNSVLGVYSTISDQLFIAPESVGEGERVSVDGLAVHELVHALQVRHSKLGEATLGLSEHDDLAFALAAVLEGDALLFETVDAQQLGRGSVPTSRAEIDAEWDVAAYREAFSDVPGVLIDMWVLPYPLGFDLARRYATESFESDGTLSSAADPNRLLVDPPLSSEQILFPEKWLDAAARDLPVFVVLPKLELEGCTEYARNTLGAIAWTPFLTNSLRGATARGLSSDAIALAVDGWGGDRYALFDCGGIERIAMSYIGDSASDASELAAVLEPALRALARDSKQLAAQLHVRRDGLRVQATLGFDAVTRERLWNETELVRFDGLDGFLDAHPEVLARAADLRARALNSGQ